MIVRLSYYSNIPLKMMMMMMVVPCFYFFCSSFIISLFVLFVAAHKTFAFRFLVVFAINVSTEKRNRTLKIEFNAWNATYRNRLKKINLLPSVSNKFFERNFSYWFLKKKYLPKWKVLKINEEDFILIIIFHATELNNWIWRFFFKKFLKKSIKYQSKLFNWKSSFYLNSKKNKKKN